jgi:hypothetical protein
VSADPQELRRIGDPGMVAVELHNLGHVEIHRGNVEAAEECFEQVPHSDDRFSEAMSRLNEATVDWLREQLS